MSAASIDRKIALDLRIPVNLTNTSASGEMIYRRLHEKALEQYRQPITYKLIQQSGEAYLLEAWHKKETIKPPVKQSLPLVIKTDTPLKTMKLHIGWSKHYFVANKAEFVDFAGDIVFLEDGTIDYFNDKSGAYVVPDKCYVEIKTASFIAAIKMGLPMHKFCMHHPSQNAKKALFIALTTTGMQEASALAQVLAASQITSIESALQLVKAGTVTATNFTSFTLSAAHSSIAADTVSKTNLDTVPPAPTTASAVNSPQTPAILAVPVAPLSTPSLGTAPILMTATADTGSSNLQQLVAGDAISTGYVGVGDVMPLPNTAVSRDAFTATVLTAPAAAPPVPPLIFTQGTGVDTGSIPTIPTATTDQAPSPTGRCECTML